ncbi:MAG TPA: selenocysteine-specific translation elongation factor [Tepidisphaeraceae bacterium]|jgi:selenocysteine-specific elongation factor|nr:selenocysteine-specific translation elongation factor [Tepidisphaeraceae bacterium]
MGESRHCGGGCLQPVKALSQSNTQVNHYIVATAGHVDHGKSALVLALSGIDPDRLPEEKARGITIDLGFASLRLSSPAGISPAAEYHIGLVDVPGHEDYVRNMVAGVGAIDAVLLVVAADDGWMPQTEEHLQILSYLGARRGIVVLSKVDLAGDEQLMIAGLRARLAETFLADAPIVPTSVTSSRGVAELKSAMAQMLSQTPGQPAIGKPRLSVDRVFTRSGIGTIVTGTLAGGVLQRGQHVVVQPGGATARIRAVQTHGCDVEIARVGSRVALNLPGIDPAADRTAQRQQTVGRGDVVTIESLGHASCTFDALLERSPRLSGESTRHASLLKHGTTVRVHHGSGSTVARVRFLDGCDLQPGQRALARLTLDVPMLALAGDRFVIRDASQQRTLAGGVVLDPDPPSGRRGSARFESQRALLAARAEATASAAVFVRSQLHRDGIAAISGMLVRSTFSADGVAAATGDESENHRAISIGTWLADAAWWKQVRSKATAAIAAYHAEHSEQGQFPITALRVIIESSIPAKALRTAAPEIAEALAEALAKDCFVRTPGGLRLNSHQPALPPRLQAAGAMLRRRLAERPLDPPSHDELCKTDLARQALRFLIASGEAVDIGNEIVLSSAAYAKSIEIVRKGLGEMKQATVSELKTLLGASRRIAVPLLEKLDRDGITQRQGNLRTLRKLG